MPRSQPTWLSRLHGAWVLLLVASQLLQGCDNPACVFGPAGCQDGAGGSGGGGGASEGLIADPPQDGEQLSPNVPQITAFFPGDGAHTETPVVLIFSESMAPAGIEDSFELIQISPDPNIPDLPGITMGGVLVGEGRVAILMPLVLIPGMDYQVALKDGVELLDRTGQVLNLGFTNVIGSFKVAETPDSTPKLLTMWPQNGTTDQSTMPQIVTVFDREMDVGTVLSPGAFAVTVDGSPPANNPAPAVLSLTQIFGTVLTIPQVFTWRSFEADGEPALLGTDAIVALDLADTIRSEEDESYPGSSTSFGTASMNPPAAVAVTSIPTHAFGVDHVNGTTPIEVTVTLSDPAGTSDFLTLYEYGTSIEGGSLNLLSREVSVVESATEVILLESDLDLVDDSLSARFSDGDVYIAASLRRGDVRSPVRLLDTDPDESGDQPAVLDTVAPILLGLGADGSQTTEYFSTTSGITVVGLADEELSAVEVEVLLGAREFTNGALAPVIGANSEGGFAATPLELGMVDPATLPGAMTVTIYDRAMNTAVPLDLIWRQVGASGPGDALPGGGDVAVRVFDAVTRQPLSGALVFAHEVDVREVFLNGGVTGSDGTTSVPSAALGATVVTVDADGYDLFTFHGVPTTRLDVPLKRTNPSPGHAFFTVTSNISELANPSVSVQIADDRMITGPVHDPLSCTDSPFGVLCGFPSVDLVEGRFGVPTVMATIEQDFFDWSPESFLKVAQLEFLTDAAEANGKISTNFEIEQLLDDISLDAEERPIDVPLVVFDLSSLLTIDTTDLVDGSPRVLLEGVVPSLGQTATVGAGSAFDVGSTWAVLSAYAGAADGVSDTAEDLLGRWVTEGLIEADLLLRIDAIDGDGNATGRRVRLSAAPLGTTLIPTEVPILSSPIFATGGSAFELEFADTLDDTHGGLYQVHITDITGRSWDVWRLDEAGVGGSLTANVPEIELFGGQPLSDGTLSVVVSLRGLPTGEFDAAGFLWGEVEAKADARAHTAFQNLQQP